MPPKINQKNQPKKSTKECAKKQSRNNNNQPWCAKNQSGKINQKSTKKSTKIQPKINQNSTKIQPTINQQSTKNQPKYNKNSKHTRIYIYIHMYPNCSFARACVFSSHSALCHAKQLHVNLLTLGCNLLCV